MDLYWLPLGAGGWFVRLNGRIYETIRARIERRPTFDLYHSALEVRVPEGRFIIEVSWPIQDADGTSRGVVLEGPVGSRNLARFRVSRYELRRWRNGIIPDADEAVASPQRLTDDPDRARRLLDLVGSVPGLVWGRDEMGTGDMWNSNSVISWLIARSGLPADAIGFPARGRAPGWDAGLVTARRHQRDAGAHTIPPRQPVPSGVRVDEPVAREERRTPQAPLVPLSARTDDGPSKTNTMSASVTPLDLGVPHMHQAQASFPHPTLDDLIAGRNRGRMPGEEG